MNNDYIGNIRTFNTDNFTVSADAYYDWDTDTSFDESGKVREQLENGDMVAFYVQVTVTHTPTGTELSSDSLGGCIYESIEKFMDHRECAKHTRRLVRRNGRFQIYRKARKYANILSREDKLRKRGFATRERAEAWAKQNTTEAYEIMESGVCGSYFTDMVRGAIAEARKQVDTIKGLKLRAA